MLYIIVRQLYFGLLLQSISFLMLYNILFREGVEGGRWRVERERRRIEGEKLKGWGKMI